jgi:hypothetical protein
LEEEEDCIIASDKRIIPQISWDRSMRYMESEGEYRKDYSYPGSNQRLILVYASSLLSKQL